MCRNIPFADGGEGEIRAPTLVADVMRPPLLVPVGTWFRDLVRMLVDAELLTIVDGRGRLVATVTEEDLLLALARRRVEEQPDAVEGVSELAGEPLVAVTPDRPAVEAARLMRQRGLRHLAVVDARGRPVGVVDRGDLLVLLLRSDGEIDGGG